MFQAANPLHRHPSPQRRSAIVPRTTPVFWTSERPTDVSATADRFCPANEANTVEATSVRLVPQAVFQGAFWPRSATIRRSYSHLTDAEGAGQRKSFHTTPTRRRGFSGDRAIRDQWQYSLR